MKILFSPPDMSEVEIEMAPEADQHCKTSVYLGGFSLLRDLRCSLGHVCLGSAGEGVI